MSDERATQIWILEDKLAELKQPETPQAEKEADEFFR